MQACQTTAIQAEAGFKNVNLSLSDATLLTNIHDVQRAQNRPLPEGLKRQRRNRRQRPVRDAARLEGKCEGFILLCTDKWRTLNL